MLKYVKNDLALGNMSEVFNEQICQQVQEHGTIMCLYTEHTQNTKHSPYIHKTATGGQSQSRPGWLVIREVGSLGRWSHHGLISTV